MVSQTQRQKTLDPVPDDLESARAKLVYLYLEVAEGATIEEVGEILAMKKINVLSVLHSLVDAGHVEKRESAYIVAN
ncbi:hypothetical protein C488_02341 [Natrinema pellirubrum DSM 15624]|uniref:Sugar-specific transcriptional regulator TrmB n=2 Tax=Natrinema TaxID=88723 RepID=L0JKB5_NATP1|nr:MULTISPECIES: MarR family transcriptional regulator [Natrinema]ELZ12325.1 hypothetical protein C478_09626 [Natrinema thermotolerans DSM 11552]AGB31027.1 Sugar-specific transcriptional regulator TrmB [Natrinema pellirubrum DSM 15624]ELY81128.1 hypothetical protein C488_02341 [Natrinema pellirubrum DSM 15624]QCC60918.1 MarR family transcriptional regulator [Natrinema thermotolerans]WMT10200.1 MarR family transcriptional regulator [Natrinema thermotolerans]